MKSIAIKLVTGLVTVGSLGGGVAYGIHKYNDTTNSIAHYLKENNLNIIATDNGTFWDKVHKTYLLEKTSSNLEIDNKTITTKDDIKDWCHSEKNSLVKSVEDALYKKVKKWCTEYKTIKETFATNKELNDNAGELNTKYGKLEQPLKNKINAVQTGTSSNTDGEKFKKWCEINSDRSYSGDQEEFAKDIKEHCLKNKDAS